MSSIRFAEMRLAAWTGTLGMGRTASWFWFSSDSGSLSADFLSFFLFCLGDCFATAVTFGSESPSRPAGVFDLDFFNAWHERGFGSNETLVLEGSLDGRRRANGENDSSTRRKDMRELYAIIMFAGFALIDAQMQSGFARTTTPLFLELAPAPRNVSCYYPPRFRNPSLTVSSHWSSLFTRPGRYRSPQQVVEKRAALRSLKTTSFG